MKKRLTWIAVIVVIAGTLFWRFFGSSKTPEGQPPLVVLSANDLNQVKTLFNSHKDKKRVIVLLSPT